MKVDGEGSISMSGDPKLLYYTMLKTRVMIICNNTHALFLGELVSIRYSISMRQFKNISGIKRGNLATRLSDLSNETYFLTCKCFCYSVWFKLSYKTIKLVRS